MAELITYIIVEDSVWARCVLLGLLRTGPLKLYYLHESNELSNLNVRLKERPEMLRFGSSNCYLLFRLLCRLSLTERQRAGCVYKRVLWLYI